MTHFRMLPITSNVMIGRSLLLLGAGKAFFAASGQQGFTFDSVQRLVYAD